MDLGAYANIENLNELMAVNGISVPRLRGLRLMKDEKPFNEEDKKKWADRIGLEECEFACCSRFLYNSNWHEYSDSTTRIRHKYLQYDNDKSLPIGVKWNKIHGKKRKVFKYKMKMAKRRVDATAKAFNKYCSREDVLYIHARIGGNNWKYYDGNEIAKQSWFLEKVDDPFDETYCDIYALIDPIIEKI